MEIYKKETAIFAGGCFWCTEAIFDSLKGVIEVVPGYTGGAKADPTYEEVYTGLTGHAEAVKITFDPSVISYTDLLEVFFSTHNPTTLNRQGADIGTHYRSEIFYLDDKQHQSALAYIATLEQEQVFEDPIVTAVSQASEFYIAEDYHQNYLALKGSENTYCNLVVTPKLQKFKEVYHAKLK